MKNIKTIGIIAVSAIIVILAACASLTVESLEADSIEGPKQVRQGQDINPRDITVYGNYKDGSRKRVSLNSSAITFNKDTAGSQTVRVKVGNSETSFQTEVMALTGIRIDSPPAKISYMQGESLILNGLKVIGRWEGMSEAEVAVSASNVSGFDTVKMGRQTVTVTVRGRIAMFDVTVTEAKPDGTWVVSSGGITVVWKFDNGNYEYSYNDPMSKGTYTISGNTITTQRTHGWGPSWGLEERWYTKEEVKADKSKSTNDMTRISSDASIDSLWKLILETQTGTFSIDGNTLTLTFNNYSSKYTKR